MKKIILSLTALSLLIAGALSPLTFVGAQGTYDFSSSSGLNQTGTAAGYDVSSNTNTLESYISRIITIVLSLLGVIFLALIIYAGVTWMTAQGNDEKVKKARELLVEAIIGLIIVLAAYAISYFVLKIFLGSVIQ